MGFTLDSSTGWVLASSKVAPAGTIQNWVVLVPSFPVRTSTRLASMACLASPPERYAFASTARVAARFLRFSFGSTLPTMTTFESASCCRRWATSSSTALQVLSTRHGLTGLGNSHSLNLLAVGGGGGGGGGFSTFTVAEPELFKPR